MIGAAAIGVLVALPWLLMVTTRYGTAPLLSAGGTGFNPLQSLFELLMVKLTNEPLWALTAGLAVLGFIYALSRRRYFVAIWAVAIVVVDPRSGGTYVAIPVAILAAIGLLDFVIARLVGVGGDIASAPGWPSSVLRTRGIMPIVMGAFILAMLSAFLAPYLLSPMASLDTDARSAMAWARTSLPASARVTVVTGREWYEDATSEWFPYLTGRRSVATVQGYEWTGAASWQAQLDLYAVLQGHATDTAASVEAWAVDYGVDFDYVYVPKGQLGGATSKDDCCTALRQTLKESSDFEIVYDGSGATIARRLASG
jgi:hypothetical protein